MQNVLSDKSKTSHNSPNEGDQVSLTVRDVLPGLECMQLTDELWQAVASDGGKHLLPLQPCPLLLPHPPTAALLAAPGNQVAPAIGEDEEGDEEEGDAGAGVPQPALQHHPLIPRSNCCPGLEQLATAAARLRCRGGRLLQLGSL